MPHRSWLDRASNARVPAARPTRRARAGRGYGGSLYPIRNAVSEGGYGAYALQAGGLRGFNSGMGQAGLDKTVDNFYIPTWVTSRYELEVFLNQSWAAQKLVSIPVDDAIVKWRRFLDEDGTDESRIAAYMEAEERWGLKHVIARAMKAGRWCGTSATLIRTAEARWDMPLDPTMIRPGNDRMPGDLRGFTTFDRFQLRIVERDNDMMSMTYREPIIYEIFPNTEEHQYVHASRILRFDGLEPSTSFGWEAYDADWGISVLIPAAMAIIQDEMVATGSTQLAMEMSMLIYRLHGFRDFIGDMERGADPEEESDDPGVVLDFISRNKSLFRAVAIDHADEVERVNASLAGIPQLRDSTIERIAAAADIPVTRFKGVSPAGMDATGDSDMKNYALKVMGDQVKMLSPQLMKADAVIARDAGLDEPPPWEWVPLVDLSEQEQADILKQSVEAAEKMVGGYIGTESDAQRLITERTGFRFMEESPDNMEREAAEAALREGREANGNGNGGNDE